MGVCVSQLFVQLAFALLLSVDDDDLSGSLIRREVFFLHHQVREMKFQFRQVYSRVVVAAIFGTEFLALQNLDNVEKCS